ncbi:SDR family oxidoreductase [soil metagenome]
MSNKIKQNTRVIITGASTGIGRGLALLLAEKYKAHLVLTARSVGDLTSAAEQVKALGGEAEIVVGDIAAEGMIEAVVEKCLTTYGGIDIIVNNAGMAIPGKFENLTMADWRRLFEVNFFTPLALTYAALPHLKKSQSAKIVNVASVAGKIAFPGSVSYCASKFALTGLSEGLAAELGSAIDVLTVCPGWVRTEFFEKNAVAGQKNPTIIAERKDLSGALMKHVLSISTKQCASDIERALAKGGSHELILTLPGQFAERLHGMAPGLMRFIAKGIPAEFPEK